MHRVRCYNTNSVNIFICCIVPDFSISTNSRDQYVQEDKGPVTICIDRTGNATISYDLALQTVADGSADEGSDFVPYIYTFTFGPHIHQMCHNFIIINDNLALEGNEYFSVVLTSTSTMLTMNISSTTVTIGDDDGRFVLL